MSRCSSPVSISEAWDETNVKEIVPNNRSNSRFSGVSSLSGPDDSTTYSRLGIMENVPFTSGHHHVVTHGNSATDQTLRGLQSPPLLSALPPSGVLIPTNPSLRTMSDSSFSQNDYGPFPLHTSSYGPKLIPISQAHLHAGPPVSSFHSHHEPQQNMHHSSSSVPALYIECGNQPFVYPIQTPHTVNTIPGSGQPITPGEPRFCPFGFTPPSQRLYSNPRHGQEMQTILSNINDRAPTVAFRYPAQQSTPTYSNHGSAVHHSLHEVQHGSTPLLNPGVGGETGSQWGSNSQTRWESGHDLSFHDHKSSFNGLHPPHENQQRMDCMQNRLYAASSAELRTEESSSSPMGGEKERKTQFQTIEILSVQDKKAASKCKYYFKNSDKGGGEIQNFVWDSTDCICYITFSNPEAANQIVKSVHMIDNQELRISLANEGIPKFAGTRTVKVSGGDIQSLDIYKLYFQNPQNGGGPISNIRAEERTHEIFITFTDAAVAEAVCRKRHIVEEQSLDVKRTSLEWTHDTLPLEQLEENCFLTVEAVVPWQQKDEMYYRHYFESCESHGSVEEVVLNTEEGKVLVTFNSGKVARKVASCSHQIDGEEVKVRLLKASPFYSDKLLFRNIPVDVTKELLINYIENVSNQDDIELLYSDEPGDVLVNFKNEINFWKIREKCQAKFLCGKRIEMKRIPFSNRVLVQNLNPNTSDDDLAYYFESKRAGGSTVLHVQRCDDQSKYVVFDDHRVAERAAVRKHLLGGRELLVRLDLRCLGSSRGGRDSRVSVLPEPLKLSMKSNYKVSFLQRSTSMLHTFNESLSKVHAHARIVDDTLTVECTLSESVPNGSLLVGGWKEKVSKELETCFDFVRLDRQEVLPEVWLDVVKAVEKFGVSEDFLLPVDEEHAFIVLATKNTESGLLEKIQSIVKDAETEFALKKREVRETKALKKHELDLLIMTSFSSDMENEYNRLHVDIQEQERKITFCGELQDIREAQMKMLELFRSTPSMRVKNMTESQISLVTSETSEDIVRQKLMSAGLTAVWGCPCEGIVTVYCVQESDLPQAAEIIRTSFKEEAIPLDGLSSSVTALPYWEMLKNELVQGNHGTLMIRTEPKSILITAVSEIIPAVKDKIQNFITENAIYYTLFRFSPSRQEFFALFWEDSLTHIAQMLSQYKVDIKWYDEKRCICVTGTIKGIKLAIKNLQKLGDQIKCTEEEVCYQKNIKNTKRIANEHNCVVACHPEESQIQIVFTNQPLTRRLVPVHMSSVTELSVEAFVHASAMEGQCQDGLIMAEDDIQKEFTKEWDCIHKTREKLSKGDVVVKGPGSLPFKSIIHADGPQYQGGDQGEQQCLRATVMNCLKTASDLGYTSIALPSFSNAFSHYPADEATRIVVEAVKTFFGTNTNSTIRDVRLYDSQEITIDLFQMALDTTSSSTELTATTYGAIGLTTKPKANTTPNVFKLYIFSTSKGNREKFLKELDELVNTKYEIKVVKDLEKMSSEEFIQVKEACKDLNMEIQERPTGPTLKGMLKDFEKFIRTLMQGKDREREETMMANLVQWYYFEGNKTGKKRKSFGKRENLLIEEAFHHYQTDKNSETAKVTEENGHVFWIKFSDNVMYSQQLPPDGFKVFRKEIIKGGVSTASLLPDNWEIQEKDEAVKLVALHPECEEYRSVYSNILKTAKELPSILSIERIQNPELHTQYEAKKAQMSKQNKGIESEKILWHGTSSEVIPYINRDGFNRSFCGKNATRFGLGVYFAVDSAYSMQNLYSPPDSVGSRYLYQCKVLVGHSKQGNSAMNILPTREGKIRYDSATDHERNPTMYVIFHDSQAYPEYLVTFK